MFSRIVLRGLVAVFPLLIFFLTLSSHCIFEPHLVLLRRILEGQTENAHQLMSILGHRAESPLTSPQVQVVPRSLCPCHQI